MTLQKTVLRCGWVGTSTKTKNRRQLLLGDGQRTYVRRKARRAAAGLGVAIPARRSVAKSKEFLAQPEHAALFYESLRYAAPVQAPANYSEVERILMQRLGPSNG